MAGRLARARRLTERTLQNLRGSYPSIPAAARREGRQYSPAVDADRDCLGGAAGVQQIETQMARVRCGLWAVPGGRCTDNISPQGAAVLPNSCADLSRT